MRTEAASCPLNAGFDEACSHSNITVLCLHSVWQPVNHSEMEEEENMHESPSGLLVMECDVSIE